MKITKFFSLLSIAMFLSLTFVNTWVGATVYDKLRPETSINGDIVTKLTAPGIMNITEHFLDKLQYDKSIKSDRRFQWKINHYEKTDYFHISEGDKKLKSGDKIIILIGADPELQLPAVDTWALIYINDVMARYDPVDNHIYSVFKYILPTKINTTYQEIDFGEYLQTTTDSWVNKDAWTVEDHYIKYNYTMDLGDSNSDGINTTTIRMVYDRSSGFMNELNYEANFINMTGHYQGVNLSMIRLHGWGLPYNITTWAVWIPIILLLIGLIVAIRLRLIQRLKLYLEARKLAKRE
ncbi:MAG: hypothetical protein ACTSUR_06910 [Candidatus Heimdallarchaeaceae archaeon]